MAMPSGGQPLRSAVEAGARISFRPRAAVEDVTPKRWGTPQGNGPRRRSLADCEIAPAPAGRDVRAVQATSLSAAGGRPERSAMGASSSIMDAIHVDFLWKVA